MDSNSYYGPNFADNGEMKLILYISDRGMSAYLKSIDDVASKPNQLFHKEWTPDENPLLSKIENAIYDNPRLLDDFATEIILQTPKTLHIPRKILEQEDGKEEELYSQIFPVETDDIFVDLNDDIATVYSLTPGLPAFVRRTLPGSRVSSHISHLIRAFRKETSDHYRIYCDIRDGEADIIIFDGTNLLSAATQPWQEADDIAYRLLQAMQAYGLKTDNSIIKISGISDVKSDLAAMLRKFSIDVAYIPAINNIGDLKIPSSLGILLTNE